MTPTRRTESTRTYSEFDLKTAVENVLSSTMTVYRASKEFKIPWSTLNKVNLPNSVISELK